MWLLFYPVSPARGWEANVHASEQENHGDSGKDPQDDQPRHPETCLFVGCTTLAASVKSHETLWNVWSSAIFIAVSTEWSCEADGTALRTRFPKRLGGWKTKLIAICHHRSTVIAIWPNLNISCWKEFQFQLCFFSVKWPRSFTKRIAIVLGVASLYQQLSYFQEPIFYLFLPQCLLRRALHSDFLKHFLNYYCRLFGRAVEKLAF